MYKAYREKDLLKAANVYSQFDKKGNLYENRLYAKTSINQAKLQNEQRVYDFAMEASADENARINNKSISERNNNGYNTVGYGKMSENSFKQQTSQHNTHTSKISNNTF